MLLYYITDRTQFSGDSRARLLNKIAEAARAGVDYIQLREKDLSSRELEALARSGLAVIAEQKAQNPELKTSLLLNSRSDIALAVGAHGVHLRSHDLSPKQAWAIWRDSGVERPTVAVSCHTPAEVAQAAKQAADFVVFAPVFNKSDIAAPEGLDSFRQACLQPVPVLALGGVTVGNARSCIEAGAAGIAGIRFFQQSNIAEAIAEAVAGLRP